MFPIEIRFKEDNFLRSGLRHSRSRFYNLLEFKILKSYILSLRLRIKFHFSPIINQQLDLKIILMGILLKIILIPGLIVQNLSFEGGAVKRRRFTT